MPEIQEIKEIPAKKPRAKHYRDMRAKLIFNPSAGAARGSPVGILDVIHEMQAWKLVPEAFLVEGPVIEPSPEVPSGKNLLFRFGPVFCASSSFQHQQDSAHQASSFLRDPKAQPGQDPGGPQSLSTPPCFTTLHLTPHDCGTLLSLLQVPYRRTLVPLRGIAGYTRYSYRG